MRCRPGAGNIFIRKLCVVNIVLQPVIDPHQQFILLIHFFTPAKLGKKHTLPAGVIQITEISILIMLAVISQQHYFFFQRQLVFKARLPLVGAYPLGIIGIAAYSTARCIHLSAKTVLKQIAGINSSYAVVFAGYVPLIKKVQPVGKRYIHKPVFFGVQFPAGIHVFAAQTKKGAHLFQLKRSR